MSTSESLHKMKLINILVQDFKRNQPDASPGDCKREQYRLLRLETKELSKMVYEIKRDKIKKELNKRFELADELARYIIEFESEDFFYECDTASLRHHIYLKAVIYRDGRKEAARDLWRARKYRQDENYSYE